MWGVLGVAVASDGADGWEEGSASIRENKEEEERRSVRTAD